MREETQVSLATPNSAWRKIYQQLNKQSVKKYAIVGVLALSLPGAYLTGQLSSAPKASALGLASEHNVYAWGDNTYGQLGDGTTTQRNSPTQVTNLGNGASQLASNNYTGYALKADGSVYAWGRNDHGQLGNGSHDTSAHSTPAQISSLSNIISISTMAGSETAFALRADGTIWSWGLDYNGSTGDGNSTPSDVLTPTEVVAPSGTSGYLTNVVAISADGIDGLALKADGTVWVWGSNDVGQLGNGTYCTTSCVNPYPQQITALSNVRSIIGGTSIGTAIKTDGTVYVWGQDRYGEAGASSTGTCNSQGCITTPTQVSGLSNITSATWGWNYVSSSSPSIPGNNYDQGLFTKSGGSLYVAGPLNTPPTSVSGVSAAVQVSETMDSTQAYLKSDGTVWTIGNDNYGQIGNGTSSGTPVTTYTQASSLTGASQISSGWDSMYAVAQ